MVHECLHLVVIAGVISLQAVNEIFGGVAVVGSFCIDIIDIGADAYAAVYISGEYALEAVGMVVAVSSEVI